MLEVLLWLLLIFRVCLRLAPYVLGLIGAAVVVHYATPGIPTVHITAVFTVVAIGLIFGLKHTLPGAGGDSVNSSTRRRHMD